MALDLSKIQTKNEKKNIGSVFILDFLNQDIQLLPYRLKDKKKETFYLELGTLLESKVDIRTCLFLIVEQHTKKKDNEFFQQINDEVIAEKSLSEAMESSQKFSTYDINSIKIGEESGILYDVLNKLGSYYQKKIKAKNAGYYCIEYIPQSAFITRY